MNVLAGSPITSQQSAAVAVSTSGSAKAWVERQLPGERRSRGRAAAPWWALGNQASDQGWRGQPRRAAGPDVPSPRASTRQAMGQHGEDHPCSPEARTNPPSFQTAASRFLGAPTLVHRLRHGHHPRWTTTTGAPRQGRLGEMVQAKSGTSSNNGERRRLASRAWACHTDPQEREQPLVDQAAAPARHRQHGSMAGQRSTILAGPGGGRAEEVLFIQGAWQTRYWSSKPTLTPTGRGLTDRLQPPAPKRQSPTPHLAGC